MVSKAKTATKVNGLAVQVDFVVFYVYVLAHCPDSQWTSSYFTQRASWARILKRCFNSPCDIQLSEPLGKGFHGGPILPDNGRIHHYIGYICHPVFHPQPDETTVSFMRACACLLTPYSNLNCISPICWDDCHFLHI